ncbi:GNAT family N-acetyltransferase [Paracoccus litorisediminis]|uniref:GNAT family N-acetyltransferase n=2 Tax=Paracoccus litorisediminis TaxID=2006130 RepID=A0A844HMA9_9RHOB|nr:helix-turn-helix domain-containing GNAT family N-acetyltransferase [Paracoccus litorisediminis]MTH59554.1 GNAT family N-acetyltransferase [Paracoccus litorisediminis]
MVSESTISEIRAVSRTIAREWGFMGGEFAGTDLSPSAVHALIEIEQGNVTARDLGLRLHLEKSSVSRMLRKLIEAGDVHESAGEDDGRVKILSLTPTGKTQVSAIHQFAEAQVASALARLDPKQEDAVLTGLRLYSRALSNASSGQEVDLRIDIVRGYQAGLIARITQMHALYYAKAWDFGQRFEAVVAGGLAEFSNRLDNPRNAIWTAQRNGQICGSVAIDGEDLGNGIAHLRWFIVDGSIQGGGCGRKLLSDALAFVDENGFAETHLWTFSGLGAARHLYESFGFVLAEEHPGDQWGKKVIEQRFVRVGNPTERL